MTGLEALGQRPAAYTPEFTYVRGNYTIGSEALDYFSVGMRVDEAVRSLTLPRDVVLDPMAPIRMEELFQRELDEARAEGEIVPYLKAPRQPKFFNALTVVVLPVKPDNERQLAHSYQDLPNRPEAPADPAFTTEDIGPVRLRSLATNPTIGYISWDTRFGRAIIIDGQHRFFAVRELMEDDQFPHRTDLAHTALPVLLLVLDRKAGFETANEERTSVLETCRSIFIDLNKHAVRVSKARQYLLDDRDLTAVSMRVIMSDEVGGASESVADRVKDTGQLPLALIDWASEEARFDHQSKSAAYVSTVLTLYDIVQMALAMAPPQSSTDYAAQRDYVSRLVARLELDDRPDFNEREIRRDIERAEDRGLPFALSNAAIRAAAHGFQQSVGALVVRSLVELSPYATLITAYEEADLLSGEFEQWLGLDAAGKAAFAEETGTDPFDVARDIWSEIKPRFRLAYQVVFQKAFVNAMVEMDDYREVVLAHWGLTEDAERGRFIDAWVERFNRVFASQLADDETWAGAGISAAGTIQWTQPSQRAIAGFTIYGLLAPLEEWAAQDDETARESARAWLEDAWSYTGAGRPAATIEGLYKQGTGWKRGVTAYVKAQFRAREADRDAEDADFLEHGAAQLLRLANGIRSEGAPISE